MSKVLVTESYLSQIANAIRSKLGGSTEYRPGDMAAAILDIPTGSNIDVEPLSVIVNGTYTAPTGKAYSPVTVNVSGGGDNPFALTDYIESSGTQWINTGYVVNGNTTMFECIANVNSNQVKNYANLFGARTSNDISNACMVTVRDTSTRSVRRAWADGSGSTYKTAVNSDVSNFWVGKKTRFVHTPKTTYIETADGGIAGNLYTMTGNVTSQPIYIFGLNQAGSPVDSAICVAKLYAFKVYENGTLVMELLPYVDNGEACLRDSISGTLFKNSGSGAFTFGQDT